MWKATLPLPAPALTDKGPETQTTCVPRWPMGDAIRTADRDHHTAPAPETSGQVFSPPSGFLKHVSNCFYLFSKTQGWGNQLSKLTFPPFKGRHCTPWSCKAGPFNTFLIQRLNLARTPFSQLQPTCCRISSWFKLWKSLVRVFSWESFFFFLPFNQLISQ